MRQFLLSLILLLVPVVAGAQGSTKSILPACLSTNITTCVPQIEGTRVRMVDGNDAADCGATGGGSTVVTCGYDGTGWTPVVDSGTNSSEFINTATGAVTLNFRDYADTTDDDMAHGIITVNCTATGTGAEECDLTISITQGGANVAVLAFDANGIYSIGSITDEAADIYLNADAIIRSTTLVRVGFVDLDTADNDTNAAIDVNCTEAATGVEDCDMTIKSQEAGAENTRINIDADGDTTFPPNPADGGNGDAQHLIVGIPKIAGFSIGTGNDGSETVGGTNGTNYIDETPGAEWTGSGTVTDSADSIIFRKGTASLSLVYGTGLSTGDGADNPLAAADNQDWSADESFGLWHRCNFIYDASDLFLGVTDNASEDATTGFPAYATADTWVWVELEVGSIADADKNIITDISFDLSAAGVTTAEADITGGGTPTCWFDYPFKWDADEELAVGADVYEDGFLSMFSVTTASANITPILEVEGTDWFAHYEAGNDFVVPITDLSNDSLWGTAALE